MKKKEIIIALLVLLMVCATGFTVAAQSAATKNETIKLIINGVEFNADRALVQAVDEPLDSVMKKFHSLEVCQNQSEDNVREQNPVKYKNWETIGEYLKKNDFNGARNAFGDLQLIDALYHFELGDSIKGHGVEWYEHQTAQRIHAYVRAYYSHGQVCSIKIKALAWIIMVYLDKPLDEKYMMIFRNPNDHIIYDYFCYIDSELYRDNGRLKSTDPYFVKQPTDGYDELIKEIGAWIDLVKMAGLDEIRKQRIAPLSSIKCEILSYDEMIPVEFFSSGLTFKIIKGIVVDDFDFEPVMFADIRYNDSINIGRTDLNGAFRVIVPDSIKTLTFMSVGFEPMKVELCDDDYLEVIMISESSDCFLTIDESNEKTKKRFNQLDKLRKEALKRGIFQNKKPCYKQIFVP